MSEVYGVTATREGANALQMKAFRELVRKLAITEFHHGDCVGGDAQAVAMVRYLWPLARIVSHPPDKKAMRAFIPSDFYYPEAEYLARNRHIAELSEQGIFAIPKEGVEVVRSGTWSTIRRGRSLGRKIWIIYPDGGIEEVN